MTTLKPFSRSIVALGFLAVLAGFVSLAWAPVNANVSFVSPAWASMDANMSFGPYAYYGGQGVAYE